MNFSQIVLQQKIHFIGIGGIGMSALALMLRKYNVIVQGSDLKENYLTAKLKQAGIKYYLGHNKNNMLGNVSLVVKTSIIKDDNPEIIYAQQHNIPIITRAELLAIVMQQYLGITVAGTHGKTTTTAIISVLLEEAKFDPTVINGGTINYFNSNYKIGQGKYLVAESDESDASFVKLPTFLGVVTNIEPEHLDFAGYNHDFTIQKQYFQQYISQIPSEGLVALNLDCPNVLSLYQQLKTQKNNLFGYSLQKNNGNLWAENISCHKQGISFDAVFSSGEKINNINMPIYGKHNVSNVLSAIAIANFLKISAQQIKNSLQLFTGVKQRFTKVGEYKQIPIIDDYAHHPTEISATLQAARSFVGNNNLICVVQPHKFSRVKDLFQDFCNAFSVADVVVVADIYSASQQPIAGITQDALIAGIKQTKHQQVIKLDDEKNLATTLKPYLKTDSLIICMGAGTISNWANNLQEKLYQNDTNN
jgi:UDP-N-acetylmuramate--alanine ligase